MNDLWKQKLKIYERLINTNGNFSRKGKTTAYTSVNGYMFSLLNKESQIGIRLPKESAEKFIRKFNTTRYKSHGAWMKDYVLIPENEHEEIEKFAPYLQESYEFVMSLPSKKGKKEQ